MRKIDDPCYRCQKRKLGCHSECEDYEKWKLKKKKENDSIRKEKEIDSIIRAHVVETVEWGKKHRHR